MTHVILQVLGNSDINVYINGCQQSSLEAIGDQQNCQQIQESIQDLQTDIAHRSCIFKMPMLALTRTRFNNPDVKFVVILTHQPDQTAAEILKSDGIWWKDILKDFFKREGIEGYLLEFIADNVADWENIADKIRPFLNQYFDFDFGNKFIEFDPKEEGSEVMTVERLTIQHSSGTPALVGALYLWGIEKKVAGLDHIDFLYISSEDKTCPDVHQGQHWKWRLKDSQIRELLEIQDFSGALQLLDESHDRYEDLKEHLEYLDKALSFNLINSGIKGDRQKIIERIGIALWSEEAFRKRDQWMHWYLRMAGAFELAILLLVEKQGNGTYEWKGTKLIFDRDKQYGQVAVAGIRRILSELLTHGKLETTIHTRVKTFTAIAVQFPEWQDFSNFYLKSKRWSGNIEFSFNTIRNKLYHTLQGDDIDRELDANPQLADTAVQWLNQLVQWVGIEPEIEACKKKYTDRVNEVKGWLQ